jgi:predicted component of type VI protein secretion system
VAAEHEKAKTYVTTQGDKLGKLLGDNDIPDDLEKAIRATEKLPRAEKGKEAPQPAPAVAAPTLAVAEALKFLQAQAGKLKADKPEDFAAKAEAAINERLAAIRRQKEDILQGVLEQTRGFEATWRGLRLAYENSLGGDSTAAKFYLVSMSKDKLIEEADKAKEVVSDDERQRHTLIEALLRDKSDRFGGTPFSLVILPFSIESRDIDFFRNLGQVGRRWRCPVVANLGPSLLKEKAFPISGTKIAGRLKDDKNQKWQQLVAADNPVEAEALTYLALLAPRVAVRTPYEFQRDLGKYKKDAAGVYRDCTVFAPASYAFAGKIDQLGSDYGVHLMPAGKSYGKLLIPKQGKVANDRYKTIAEAEDVPTQYPLESDLYKSDANDLWAHGVLPVVKWEDTGTLNIYGDATLLTNPDKLKEGEPMTSLGVRLTHDHVLHYCNRYLYGLIGDIGIEDVQAKAKRDLTAFLLRNKGEHKQRPLSDFSVKVEVPPGRTDELVASIELEVKKALRKVTVNLKIRKDGDGVEDESRK